MEVLRVLWNFPGLWSIQRGFNISGSSTGEQVEAVMRFTSGTMKGTKGHVGPATSQQTQVKSAQGAGQTTSEIDSDPKTVLRPKAHHSIQKEISASSAPRTTCSRKKKREALKT